MKSKMVIEYVDIQTIKSYSKNAKIHSKSQIEKIAKSIEKFGWKQNLVIDKGGVLVAGHGRYEAAKLLGLKEVPCVRADDLTEDEIRAYRLIDNEIAKGDTDWDLFNEELGKIEDVDMDDFDIDIPDTFSVDDIQDFGGYDKNDDDREFFNKTFTFPIDKKKAIISYLSKHQNDVIERIIKEAEKDG